MKMPMEAILKQSEFKLWLNSDNVVKLEKDLYLEHTTQWRKEFSLEQLKEFFIREFIEL